MTTISQQIERPPADQKVTLHNVGWETYEKLLADVAGQHSVRLSYFQGTLEIMSPLSEHEILNRIITLLIEVLAEELDIEVRCLGSTTFKREDLASGFEPDSCFYIQHEPAIRGKMRIDLANDPPPDLVVEVDITSGSLNKFPLYSHIGIAEIWRYDGQKLTLYRLDAENYLESTHSIAFPIIESAKLADFIEKNKVLSTVAFIKACRAWIYEYKSQ